MNSTYWLNTIMNKVYHDPEAQFYIGLSATLEKTEEGNFNFLEPERGATNYNRTRITDFTYAENGILVNEKDIVFSESTASWWDGEQKAQYWVLFDGPDETAHALSAGSLDTPHFIERNTVITIPAGLLAISIMDYDSISSP